MQKSQAIVIFCKLNILNSIANTLFVENMFHSRGAQIILTKNIICLKLNNFNVSFCKKSYFLISVLKARLDSTEML